MDNTIVTQLELPLKNIVRKTANDHKKMPSIFFLHGFGSNMHDLFGLVPFFGNNWNCISLQASIKVHYDGWCWAELNPINIRQLPNPNELKRHYEKVLYSIEKSIKVLDLNPNKINLLGFSQGASLSIFCGLNRPEMFKSIVALCGYVPEDNIRLEIDTTIDRDIDIFMGNGTLDQMVPLTIAYASRDYLSSISIQPFFKEYISGHEISQDCIQDVVNWLNQKNDK